MEGLGGGFMNRMTMENELGELNEEEEEAFLNAPIETREEYVFKNGAIYKG